MISVPLRKFLEFLTIPVMEPSGFCVNFPIIGISSATTLGAAAPAPPKSEKPPAGFETAFGLTGSGATTTGLLGADDPPKMLNVPLPWTGFLV